MMLTAGDHLDHQGWGGSSGSTGGVSPCWVACRRRRRRWRARRRPWPLLPRVKCQTFARSTKTAKSTKMSTYL